MCASLGLRPSSGAASLEGCICGPITSHSAQQSCPNLKGPSNEADERSLHLLNLTAALVLCLSSGSASFVCFICWPMMSHLAQHPFHSFPNSEGCTRWILMDPAYPNMHCGPAFSLEERAGTVNDAAGHLLI